MGEPKRTKAVAMFHIHQPDSPDAVLVHRHLHIPHPHLPEYEPHPVSSHREPSYLEKSRMAREMGHL
ncbi:hypothetical protein BST26_09825 [Mycolicibacterium insubricum]|uniref:Uncharacterized protein n=2 Tax=Mycolicibacterium insubricum TaxID=444597 RepID=A0A1X0DEI9_9MYCO|nr:hypothetical protein BST26_09825 [Mycolicibacterium insubricum]